MIITRSTLIDSHDIERFAWSGLRRFSNSKTISKRIIQRFQLSSRQHQNAEKQAEQLSFCLSQSSEYFAAAAAASLATRPVHLYYGCMALALAEILWKGTGNVSLDKLRSGNGRHGLCLSVPPPKDIHDLSRAGRVNARIDDRGTFVVWRKFSRHHPLVGIQTLRRPNGGTETSPLIMYFGEDKEYAALPAAGIDFLECAKSLPTMFATIGRFGQVSHLVRARIMRDVTVDPQTNAHRVYDTVIIHPGDQQKIAAVEQELKFDPPVKDRIARTDFSSGFLLKFWFDPSEPGPTFRMPEGSSLDTERTLLGPASLVLNEFGYFYVALYIAGMFSRYYPDIWMRHLAEHTDLGLLVERICADAAWRLPLLALSELEQTLYIRNG